MIAGEGRVPILYGRQPMALPPHPDGYVSRPDTVSAHPAIAIATGEGVTNASRTLARYLARYGYSAVVPPNEPGQLEGCLEAFGAAWDEWSSGDRRAVLGLGTGADAAAVAAATHGLPLILLDPAPLTVDPSGSGPVLALVTGTGGFPGRVVTYRSAKPGFWDDLSPGYDLATSRDALERIVAFLDRHLAVPAAA